MYYDFAGREIEDLEMDNMRRDAYEYAQEERKARGAFIAAMRKPENLHLYQALLHLKINHPDLHWQEVYHGLATGATRINDFGSSWGLETSKYMLLRLYPDTPGLTYEDFHFIDFEQDVTGYGIPATELVEELNTFSAEVKNIHTHDAVDEYYERLGAAWDEVNNGLHQLVNPRRCEVGKHSMFNVTGLDKDQCSNVAFWQYDGVALCKDCMAAMSRMNEENEEAFAPALAEM